jgi:hypothetical protein
MQAAAAAAVTARKVELAAAALVVVVAEQETIPIPTATIDNCQPVTPVTVSQEPVVVVAQVAITEAFHTGSAAKVAPEL